ncbi:HEAT repeat domain-containing protein [Nocardia wallacei]|uniref:HEAT repeat domain-containing protein n=1 Tax=Nocardia wallacei TaxID=480035 RepID=UPI0024585701|nr:HEAT repeat domain-containing protein [Nocardia wallacei]
MIDKDSDTAPTEALEMSEDESWSLRVEATELLGRVIEKAKARGRLEQMLDDPDIAVQTAAAEVLTRQGGADGLLADVRRLLGLPDDEKGINA